MTNTEDEGEKRKASLQRGWSRWALENGESQLSKRHSRQAEQQRETPWVGTDVSPPVAQRRSEGWRSVRTRRTWTGGWREKQAQVPWDWPQEHTVHGQSSTGGQRW